MVTLVGWVDRVRENVVMVWSACWSPHQSEPMVAVAFRGAERRVVFINLYVPGLAVNSGRRTGLQL